MIQRRCGTSVMTSKYRAWVLALAGVAVSCAPQAVLPSPSATASTTLTPLPSRALNVVIPATVKTIGRWHLVPDGLYAEKVGLSITFEADPFEGAPRARIRGSSQDILLERSAPLTYLGAIDLAGLTSGEQTVEALVRVRDQGYVVAGTGTFLLSQPEYVVWTLDFEGDASGDPELANTAANADGLKVPMRVVWNPPGGTTG